MQEQATDRTRKMLVAALRQNLKSAPEEEPFPFDRNIADFGLDSLAAISLLIDLERSFGVVFPAALLTEETFRTAGTLEKAIRMLTEG